ncbi:hypothetical protein FOCC_FOCC002141 [Frankliniella occidentalis]|nr:hypothetical protein FOCC_FOCC002141 [Frankliniella occidentalis]
MGGVLSWKCSSTAATMREEAVCNMPYRTTPLVLPGAKVKKEDNVTDCYLRHHPNPMMRAPPGHGGEWLPADVVMKQKVINKPFNTPIGLYSEQNIVDTIHKTLGSPNNASLRQAPKVRQKINPPPTQRVHQKTISTAPNPYYQVNTMGVPAERIQQSGSFNRLMHMVMNDM